MLRSLIVTACLAIPVVASCHDFWMQPERYQLKDGEAVPFAFLIGDAGKSEPWKLRWERVVSLQLIGPDAVTRDLQTGIRLTTADDKGGAVAQVSGPGTHIIVFQSHHSYSDLDAARFNPYVISEGLTPAIEQRKASKTTAANGRELYSRRSKTLLQVGSVLSAQVTQPIGQTLEIVPEAHPYAVRADNALPIRIYFRGKPLAGARVTVHRVDAEIDKLQTLVSDAEGLARFTVPPVGAWKANVVWTQPITGHERAEFETIFTSLSFGY